MRRYSKLFFLIGCIAAALFLWPGTPRHRITEETIDQIQLGMTKQEVYDILGAAPGDYGPGKEQMISLQLPPFSDLGACETWSAGDLGLLVAFSEERVIKTLPYLPVRTHEKLLARVQAWLGLPWW